MQHKQGDTFIRRASKVMRENSVLFNKGKKVTFLNQAFLFLYLSHSCLLKSLCLETNPLILLKRFHPSSQAHISQSATFATSSEASNDLVKASAEAVTTAWFPEPAVFLGDPLKLSFQTLIDHKNPRKALLFTQVCVSGPAKRATEGHYFLVGTTSWLMTDLEIRS